MTLLLLLGPMLDWYFAEALALLEQSSDVEIAGALIESRSGGFRYRAFWRELTRGRGGFALVMAADSVHRSVRHAAQPSMEFMRSRGLPAWTVSDLYAPETIELMRSIGPDAIFRSGFGIIREPVLSLPPQGVLSYHHGDIRRYRGQPVGFWELYNGEREMGVTLQILGEKLDAGMVVAERSVPIYRTDSWRQVERRAYGVGVDMLPEACASMAHGTAAPFAIPKPELGRLYTLPNFRQWLALQGKVLGRKAVALTSTNAAAGSRARGPQAED